MAFEARLAKVERQIRREQRLASPGYLELAAQEAYERGSADLDQYRVLFAEELRDYAASALRMVPAEVASMGAHPQGWRWVSAAAFTPDEDLPTDVADVIEALTWQTAYTVKELEKRYRRNMPLMADAAKDRDTAAFVSLTLGDSVGSPFRDSVWEQAESGWRIRPAVIAAAEQPFDAEEAAGRRRMYRHHLMKYPCLVGKYDKYPIESYMDIARAFGEALTVNGTPPGWSDQVIYEHQF